jgi:putative oxidoreductase
MAGFLFLWHGSQKWFNFPPLPPGIVLPFYMVAIAGTIEFIGGILICIGLWTPAVAFIASGEMAYAYWSTHAHRALLPMVNMGELAVIYCFVFLFISTYGSGIWSVDSILKRQHKSEFKE